MTTFPVTKFDRSTIFVFQRLAETTIENSFVDDRS